MKKILFVLAIMPLLIMGCSKDKVNDFDFDYDIELLQGEWRIAEIEVDDGVYIDITTPEAEAVVKPTYVTFYSNGTLTMKGAIGDYNGKYTTNGKNIIIYRDGKKYLSGDFESLSASTAVVKLTIKDVDFGLDIPEDVETVRVRFKKAGK